MGRASPRYPTPRKRFHHGAWEIYWRWKGEVFSLHPGRYDQKDQDIEADLRMVATILAVTPPTIPAFPARWAAAKGVVRYLESRYTTEAKEKGYASADDMLAAYQADLTRHCSKRWAMISITQIRNLHKAMPGGILKTGKTAANDYLDSLLDRGLTPSTRNRYLAIISRFFNWALERKLVAENPVAGLKTLKIPDREEIVYCTKEERGRIIAAAKKLGRDDWLAIPVAFYAGCRRKEVFNLEWTDINFDTRRLVVRESKTGRRTTPIAKPLLAILEKHRQPRGRIVAQMKNETWANQADRLVELLREKLCRPENPNAEGKARESVGKRRFVMTDDELRGLAAGKAKTIAGLEKKLAGMKEKTAPTRKLAAQLQGLKKCPLTAYDGGEWLPAERIGWNAWRHTFASLRVQAGVSLDKVCNWMGNSRKICEKHYAQFMPRDAVDEDIDK